MKKIAVLLLLVCPGLSLAQPGNDICQNSFLIVAQGTLAGTNVAAGASLFGVGTCGLAGEDVWYRYVATGTGNKLIVSTCPPGTSSVDTGIDIFTGATCFGLAQVSCTTAWCVNGTVTSGRAVVNSTVNGTTYWIRVKSTIPGQTGTFTISVQEIPGAAQPNGTCGSAFTLVNGVNTNKSNIGEPAALQAGFTPCATAGKDVFFTYTATGTGGTVIRTCFPVATAVPALNARDTVLSVYSSCAGGSPLVCSDNGCGGVAGTGANLSNVTLPTTQGSTYVIQVAGAGTGAAAAEGVFDIEIIPPPPNDECVGALPLLAGTNGPFTNQAASTSVGFSASCSAGYNDMFYSYTATCGGLTTISTGCAGFDTVLSVLTGCAGTQVACNDNATTGGCSPSSSVTVNMTGGVTYLIRVASAVNGTSGNFNVDISAGFGLNWTSPFGPGSLQFSICNGPSFGSYYLFGTPVAGAFPNGWFYGIDMTLSDIAGQINSGFPFNGPLNASGAMTSPVIGLPSGLSVYTVAFAVVSGGNTASANSGAKSYTIP